MYSLVNLAPSRTRRSSYASAIVVAAALAVPHTTWAESTNNADQQLWTELDAVVPVSSNFWVTAVSQLRLSEEQSNPSHTALGGDVNYKFGDAWTVALGYLHQVSGNREENPNITQTARLTSSYTYRFGRNTLVLRGRVQDNITSSSNPWQLRLRAEYRWAPAPEHPGLLSYLYVNDEVFYQFSNEELFRNRFQVGANLIFTEAFSARVYYQYQNTKNNDPKVINALGILAVYAFD